MLKNVVIPWYFCVTVLFQFLYQVSVGKIRPNIVFRVKKVTCKPFDKGQKSTRCTSLRKLLGIFTVSLMMRNTNTDSSPNAPSLSHLVSSITDDTPAHQRAKKYTFTLILSLCAFVSRCNRPCDGETSHAGGAQLKDTRSHTHPFARAASRDARAPGIILARRDATRPKML